MNQKKRAPCGNGYDHAVAWSDTSRPPIREAILIHGGSYIMDETPKIASSGKMNLSVKRGRDSIFARDFAALRAARQLVSFI